MFCIPLKTYNSMIIVGLYINFVNKYDILGLHFTIREILGPMT